MKLIEELKHAKKNHKLIWKKKLYQNGYIDAYNEVFKIVENHSDWTPVSVNDIPDIEVICCDDNGETAYGYIFADKRFSETGFSAKTKTGLIYDIVAWMPKPVPYEED